MDVIGHQSSAFPQIYQPCSGKTHNEVFQALAAEGDVLLPKPFLDPTPPAVQPRFGLLHFHVFGKLKETSPTTAISI
jgi:hypothetical protein